MRGRPEDGPNCFGQIWDMANGDTNDHGFELEKRQTVWSLIKRDFVGVRMQNFFIS